MPIEADAVLYFGCKVDKIKKTIPKNRLFLAGTAGFEPASAGVKVPCLTAWRRPNIVWDIKIRKASALRSVFKWGG